MRRFHRPTLSKGDAVRVNGTVVGFNVGGEVLVDFGPAYGSPSGEVWVGWVSVKAIEPTIVRLRRRIARALLGLAGRLSEDVVK